MNEYSIFDYLYRDAGNYKSWRSLLLEGCATSADIEAVKARLDRGEFFIAEQLGIPAAYAQPEEDRNTPTEDDHVWHEFSELRPALTDEMAGEPWGTVAQLVMRFRSVTRWDERLSPHWDL
jgi:hypothetical protein